MPTNLAPEVTAELAASIDAAAACEFPGSDHAAEHVAVCRSGCELTLLLCGTHMDELRALVARRALSGELFGCVLCRTQEASLDAAFDVEPMNRSQ